MFLAGCLLLGFASPESTVAQNRSREREAHVLALDWLSQGQRFARGQAIGDSSGLVYSSREEKIVDLRLEVLRRARAIEVDFLWVDHPQRCSVLACLHNAWLLLSQGGAFNIFELYQRNIVHPPEAVVANVFLTLRRLRTLLAARPDAFSTVALARLHLQLEKGWRVAAGGSMRALHLAEPFVLLQRREQVVEEILRFARAIDAVLDFLPEPVLAEVAAHVERARGTVRPPAQTAQALITTRQLARPPFKVRRDVREHIGHIRQALAEVPF
jgi:hypothetical protein